MSATAATTRTTTAAGRSAASTMPTSSPARLGRLTPNAQPTAIALDLTLDPARPTYTGSMDADLEIPAPTAIIWLHAAVRINKVTLTGADGNSLAPTVQIGPDYTLGLATARPLPAGPAHLHIDFEAGTTVVDPAAEQQAMAAATQAIEQSTQPSSFPTMPHGVFRENLGGDWYLFTQFEPTAARRAFPCFDEPGYKILWQVTLRVPKAATAYSNTAAETVTDQTDGTRVYAFARTRPLPSYLVAFAVGPFAEQAAGHTGSGAPIRVVGPRTEAAAMNRAATIIPTVLPNLEQYIGTPYPYPKLDLVVTPGLLGAMENPGLITCDDSYLAFDIQSPVDVVDPGTTTLAHELAHSWFGDLVTPAWWNDEWLSEGLAEWASEYKAGDAAKSGGFGYGAMALSVAAQGPAQAVRHPAASQSDIESMFGPYVYGEPADIMAMLEGWVGEDAIQKAVRSYLTAHSDGTATTQDFLDALAAHVLPSSPASQVLSRLLDEAGLPFVHIALTCTASPPATVTLSVDRYQAPGTPDPHPPDWLVPICMRYPNARGHGTHEVCPLVAVGVPETVALDGASTCPKYVVAKEGDQYFYLVDYEGDLFKGLVSANVRELPVNDAQLLYDAGWLTDAQAGPMTGMLRATKQRGAEAFAPTSAP
jgi:alanyl aminopeptidase